MEGSPAAELLVTFEWSDWRNAQYWWIQSLYVVPEHRRKGIFRCAIALAAIFPCSSIWKNQCWALIDHD